jgi:hypothetical protein
MSIKLAIGARVSRITGGLEHIMAGWLGPFA